MFPLVDYGKVLCSSANELQQNSNASFKEEYILRKLTFCSRFIVFTFDLLFNAPSLTPPAQNKNA